MLARRPRRGAGAGGRCGTSAFWGQPRRGGRPGLLFFDPGGFRRVILGLFGHGGCAARAVPCGLPARGGRGLLRQEFGQIEGGLGGGDTHGSSFRVRPDDDGGHRQSRPPRYGRPPEDRGVWVGYAPFRGGKIGGYGVRFARTFGGGGWLGWCVRSTHLT